MVISSGKLSLEHPPASPIFGQLEPRTSQRLFGRVSVFNTVEAQDESHGIIRHIPEQFVGRLVFPIPSDDPPPQAKDTLVSNYGI
jgi:hypothetical protein